MNRSDSDPYNTADDSIVTTITDLNVRSIYAFDNYNWGTNNSSLQTSPDSMLQAGALMLGYNWDYNSDSVAALDEEDCIRSAWDQMKEIYGANGANTLPSDVDSYLDWALTNNSYATIVWSNIDGVGGGYRMADVALNQIDPNTGGQTALWQACQTSYNADSKTYTGLFPAGEAVAWLGLSGWIEGAIETGLAATIGVVQYLNKHYTGKAPSNAINGNSFCLPMLPGPAQYTPPSSLASATSQVSA
jgi:lysine 2-monooxygenase